MTEWFNRPVLHVTDVEASLRFYVDGLGFTINWRYDEEGRAVVAEVGRQGTTLILAEQWPQKAGKGMMFISLNTEPPTPEAGIAACEAIRTELASRGVHAKDGHWGFKMLIVDDPDGNQLFFAYPNPNEPAAS